MNQLEAEIEATINAGFEINLAKLGQNPLPILTVTSYKSGFEPVCHRIAILGLTGIATTIADARLALCTKIGQEFKRA